MAFHEFLSREQCFLLVGHKGPDGDCLGSMIALRRLLLSMGKECSLLLEKAPPFEFSFLEDLKGVLTIGEDAPTKNQVLILMDCNSLERTGEAANRFSSWKGKRAVIDHHRISDGEIEKDFFDAAIVDPSAASTTLLVWELYLSLEKTPDPIAAEALLLGILTDTYWFQNSNSDSRAMEAAYRILEDFNPRRGTYELFDLVFRQYPQEVLDLIGKGMAQLEKHDDGRLLLITLSLQELRSSGIEEFESEVLIRPLLSVRGAELIAVAFERKPGVIKFSLRSKGNGFALAAARVLGGGGHLEAAGAEIEGTIQEARQLFLEAWRGLL